VDSREYQFSLTLSTIYTLMLPMNVDGARAGWACDLAKDRCVGTDRLACLWYCDIGYEVPLLETVPGCVMSLYISAVNRHDRLIGLTCALWMGEGGGFI
jgi:hypothetical protein